MANAKASPNLEALQKGVGFKSLTILRPSMIDGSVMSSAWRKVPCYGSRTSSVQFSPNNSA